MQFVHITLSQLIAFRKGPVKRMQEGKLCLPKGRLFSSPKILFCWTEWEAESFSKTENGFRKVVVGLASQKFLQGW